MRAVKVKVPDLDLGTAELRTTVWHVKPGQQLSFGDRLLEIWAGDVILDLPAPVDGILREIHVGEDELVIPGQDVATIGLK
jgi:pyruvate/2-oxoglutarate dehydrogenase complex dihydrolipoamide acyltransferase (E2) component